MNEEKALEEMSRLAGTQTEKSARRFRGRGTGPCEIQSLRWRSTKRSVHVPADCRPL